MRHYDVFNGDADGICALQQLRLAQPREAVLVTGLKRDIALLARVDAQAGDSVTVLDVSLHRNREALQLLLARGVSVDCFDHHYAGEVPVHPLLHATLDPAPGICTSLLVDRHLQGRQRRWAVVGAFGDNMPAPAQALAAAAGLAPDATARLRALGEAINYNAYGETEADVLVPAARLVPLLRPFADPLEFLAREPLAQALVRRQAEDLAQALAVAPAHELPGATVVLLPDAPWARRVLGTLANALSQREPARAHAVLRASGDDAFVASVRAPQRDPRGADALCLGFPTGGGRAAAGGIDHLPRAELDAFLDALTRAFPAPR